MAKPSPHVLSGYGVSTIIADINDAAGVEAAKRAGEKVHFIKTDVTSDADIEALVHKTVEINRSARFYRERCACTYLDNGAETTVPTG